MVGIVEGEEEVEIEFIVKKGEEIRDGNRIIMSKKKEILREKSREKCKDESIEEGLLKENGGIVEIFMIEGVIGIKFLMDEKEKIGRMKELRDEELKGKCIKEGIEGFGFNGEMSIKIRDMDKIKERIFNKIWKEV